jgi:hypothetical protein
MGNLDQNLQCHAAESCQKFLLLGNEFSGMIVEYQSCGEFIDPPTVKISKFLAMRILSYEENTTAQFLKISACTLNGNGII